MCVCVCLFHSHLQFVDHAQLLISHIVPDAPGSSASTAASSTSATDKARTKAVKPLRRDRKRYNELNGISVICKNICS